ncbi:hypothetical protein NDU88_008551 [Pleurodeles waltl]|uniref:Uncharacterized protein n=1 Tax=Pleurodeles waltl TaxID=8319 RepID=A0AAV7NWE0_PLEWA|nr:hypothetical protein NDU88_008551 [Pleurodeles waltl]
MPCGSHQTKLDRFALPREMTASDQGPDTLGQAPSPALAGESPMLEDIMVTIQEVCFSLETRIDLAIVEVSLLCQDLHSIGVRVKAMEVSTAFLKADATTFKAEINALHTTTKALEARSEDHGGH